MIKINRETDYAIVLITSLAQTPSCRSATALAGRCRLPMPVAGKILKRLSQAGLLTSQRGAHGGYRLARAASLISVADVIEAIEGPIALTECSVDADSGCAYQSHCGVSGHWGRINSVVRDALRSVSLDDMGGPREAVLPVVRAPRANTAFPS